MEQIINITNSFWFQSILKITLGFVLAGIIGLERSSWNKPAGFRTHSLVGVSAVLIMLCGEFMSREYDIDPSRIPAQLLSGIGFIGAGTILRDGFNVKGLTTAAGLLAVTCIGLSIGAGFYLGGIFTTLIVYLVLSYSYKISDRLDHFNILELQVTISKNTNDEMKLNINSYIGKQEINKQSSEKNVNIKVLEKYQYMDYEIYSFEVTNNSDIMILLNNNNNADAMYLRDENKIQYPAYTHEISEAELKIASGETKRIRIKYYNKYSSSRKIKSIVFSKIILNYYAYINYQNVGYYKNYGIIEIDI